MTLVLREGYLSSNPDLCEDFIAHMGALVEQGLDDKSIYKSLRQFYEKNEDVFHACFKANKDDRALLRAQKMKDLLPPGFRPERILDVGCGDGVITSYLGEIFNLAAQNVYGVDIYERHDKGLNFQYLPYSDESLIPAEDDCFDLTIALMVMHHAPDALGLLAEMRRTLSDKGRVLIRETDSGYPGGVEFNTVNDELFFRVFQENQSLAQNLNFNNEKTWRSAFERAGFSIVKTNHSECDRVFNPVWFLLEKNQGPGFSP